MFHEIIQNTNSWKEFSSELSLLGEKDKGTAFEELSRLYFLTEPTFRTKIQKIWHHSDVPQDVVDELGLQKPEIGVDLIAQVNDGTYWAIQCKWHQDQTRNVSYKELSTFFSITERQNTYSKLSHRIVCTSAADISRRVNDAHSEKIGFITYADFSKLKEENFERFRSFIQTGQSKIDPFIPKHHQAVALEKSCQYFNNPENARGKIIHPCGSGKSLTGYWLADRLDAKKVLIAVPSLALVKQTLATWTREAVANEIDMDWIAVCSDSDVTQSEDPLMKKVDLGIAVGTNPQIISDFMVKKSSAIKVVITTYQSGGVISEGLSQLGLSFDLGVFDEAHKTVGQKDKKFAHLLYDKNINIKNRVFMTATERQFKGKSSEYISMDDPNIYGPVIDTISFKAALEQDEPILCDYKIVTTIVQKSEVREFIENNKFLKTDGEQCSLEADASTFASIIALRKLMKERHVKHTVSFHNNIKRAKEFQNLCNQTNVVYPGSKPLNSYHVSGKVSTGKRSVEIERFVKNKPSLITNARCLTEGVDVPAIDAVLFADPKQSKIDIVQAAGRAMRKFVGKKFGYIVIPVILEDTQNELDKDDYSQIISVISALGMNDDRIIEEFKAKASGQRSSNKDIVIIDVPDITRINLQNLISDIEIEIWDRLSFGWIKGYEKLKAYQVEHGDTRVPREYKTPDDNFSLGHWVGSRRQEYKKGTLSKERIADLEALKGWVWDVSEAKHQEGLDKLKAYQEEFGDTRVAHVYKTSDDNYSLGAWVGNKRHEYKKGTLSKERIADLEAFEDWVWDPLEADYQEGLDKLKAYQEEFGDTRVAHVYKTSDDNYSLGLWVGSRRQDYKKGTLSKERIADLEAFEDWVWDLLEADFQEGLDKLKTYQEEFGDTRVPHGYKTPDDNFSLGHWVSSRRQDYKKGTLSKERIADLEAIKGWVWDTLETDFQEGLDKLKTYQEEHGDTRVPRGYKTPDDNYSLGRWVGSRRQYYKKGALSDEKIADLEAFEDWVWDVSETDYQEGLDKLKAYQVKFGDTRVAHRYKTPDDNYSLGRWVGSRRQYYKKGKLSAEKIADLEALKGWVWDVSEADFQEGLDKLKAYQEEFGDTRRLRGYKTPDGFALGNWVSSRRQEYKKGTLSDEKIADLEALKGWVWDVSEADFQEGLDKLKAYQVEHGDTRVPREYKTPDDNFSLGNWVGSRRQDYKKGTLSDEKIADLEALKGWVWDVSEADFQEGLDKLKTYQEEFGDTRVPRGYKTPDDNFSLGHWVGSRRQEYKKGTLSKERIADLEALKGWVWDTLEADFQEGLDKLKTYQVKHGDTRVPHGYKTPDGFALGNGVGSRRQEYKKGTLSDEKIADLEALKGWVWDVSETDFQEGLDKLKTYQEEFGDTRVPRGYKTPDDNFSLGNWVGSRRQDYKKGTLSDEKIADLEALKGWVWDVSEADFQEGLDKLKTYQEEHGDTRVPRGYKTPDDNFSLGLWVGSRRQDYKKGTLSDEKIADLEALKGWVWDVSEAGFQEGLDKLKTYQEEHGDTRVLHRYKTPDGFALGNWVGSRRQDYKKGTLSKERIADLEAFEDWVWSVK